MSESRGFLLRELRLDALKTADKRLGSRATIAGFAVTDRGTANQPEVAPSGQRKEQPIVAGNNNICMQLQAAAAIFCRCS